MSTEHKLPSLVPVSNADENTAQGGLSGGRIALLSGVGAVLLVLAGFAVAGSPPNESASVGTIVAYYGDHTAAQTTSGVLLSLGALLFLIFASTLAAHVRTRLSGPSPASALCIAGGSVLAAGLTVYAGLAIAIADVAGHVDGAALQALNVLADGPVFIFLVTIGTSAFLLGAAAASLVTTLLPRWLGWLAVVFAVIGAIPSHVFGGTLDHIGLLAFLGLGFWTLVSSVYLARSNPSPSPGHEGLRVTILRHGSSPSEPARRG